MTVIFFARQHVNDIIIHEWVTRLIHEDPILQLKGPKGTALQDPSARNNKTPWEVLCPWLDVSELVWDLHNIRPVAVMSWLIGTASLDGKAFVKYI